MNQRVSFWVSRHVPKGGDELLEPVMNIGEVAHRTNLSGAALRRYEAMGLVIFHRSENGYRKMSLEDLTRIRQIRRLIRKMGLNLEGIRRIWAMLPCWEIKSCSERSRASCPFFGGRNEPCWEFFKGLSGCEDYNCRTCEVYRMAPWCTDDIKRLIIDLSNVQLSIENPVSRKDGA